MSGGVKQRLLNSQNEKKSDGKDLMPNNAGLFPAVLSREL